MDNDVIEQRLADSIKVSFAINDAIEATGVADVGTIMAALGMVLAGGLGNASKDEVETALTAFNTLVTALTRDVRRREQ